MNLKDKLRKELIELKDDEYMKFHSKLCDTKYEILGVRLPQIRKLAKELSKENLPLFLENCYDDYYEEVMLQGLAIAYYKTSCEDLLKLINIFIYKIDNWAICDSFCNTLKTIDKNKDYFFPFIIECINSKEEFITRFGIIIALNYYIDDTHIDTFINLISNINSSLYYVQMAQAWYLAEVYLTYPDKVMNILKEYKLNKFVHNKSIQKMIESYRIDNENKDKLRKLKLK